MSLLSKLFSFVTATITATVTAATPPPIPEKPLPLVLDVDTGRDDAWALLGASDNFDLHGVVVSYGNIARDLALKNTVHVLALAQKQSDHKKDVHVWPGEQAPLQPVGPVAAAELARRSNINGNGLCNLPLDTSLIIPAAKTAWQEDVVQSLRENGPVDYIVCGPKTNLCHLIDAFGVDEDGQPLIKKYVRRVIAMGGSFAQGLAVDFNYLADPAAAQKVLNTFGDQVILVPFDETRKLKLTEEDILKLEPENDTAAFSRALMLAHARGWSADGTILLHDPATLLALEKDMILERQTVSVVQDGPAAGKIVETPDGVTVNRLVVPEEQADTVRNKLLKTYMRLTMP